jgi:hypothetical protein
MVGRVGLWQILKYARFITKIVVAYSSKWPNTLDPRIISWVNQADEILALLLVLSENSDGGPT